MTSSFQRSLVRPGRGGRRFASLAASRWHKCGILSTGPLLGCEFPVEQPADEATHGAPMPLCQLGVPTALLDGDRQPNGPVTCFPRRVFHAPCLLRKNLSIKSLKDSRDFLLRTLCANMLLRSVIRISVLPRFLVRKLFPIDIVSRIVAPLFSRVRSFRGKPPEPPRSSLSSLPYRCTRPREGTLHA